MMMAEKEAYIRDGAKPMLWDQNKKIFVWDSGYW
jgi:hypothetical protein